MLALYFQLELELCTPLQMENLYKLELELLIVETRNFLADRIKIQGLPL